MILQAMDTVFFYINFSFNKICIMKMKIRGRVGPNQNSSQVGLGHPLRNVIWCFAIDVWDGWICTEAQKQSDDIGLVGEDGHV